ncbi:MAG: tetratricopeptide repeat protein [Planctomycetota bacterium]|nr:tetratricopeptide repeat protein [Planctomycetota bacterium]
MSHHDVQTPAGPARVRYVPAVGPGLRVLLHGVLGLFALLALSGGYLVAVTIAEWTSGQTIQNYFYQGVFLVHLFFGLLLVVPFVVFGLLHIRNAYRRPNRRAVRAGLALFVVALVLVASGVVLTRIEGLVEVKSPTVRSVAYWAHVVTPILVIWLFVLHRLAGPRIHWKTGFAVGGVGVLFAVLMVAFHFQDPRQWNVEGPASGEKYFFPSLARTATGNFIPAKALMMDRYCLECHEDNHRGWAHSAHRLSSFNNPPYLFSVRETRRKLLERDQNVQGSRFCAGCHDPVPFFSGAFDDPQFDDENHPTAHAGITCTACHAITHINSVRGNADYTIEEPVHYPFAYSENRFLQWVNQQLVKAKPDFHKRTFLKPLHRSPEFCGACHKVHLPHELNKYHWLRGQNHYDSYHLSGVSGHGVSSFYYPPEPEHNCNGCHMPLEESGDFGARYLDDSGKLKVHGHQFPAANTGLPHLLKLPAWVIEEHRKFLDGVMRVDIFGVKEGGTIDGELTAPLRPSVPSLEPGKTYLLETVIRTLKMGHHFTQGTADSNEVWMELTLRSGGRVIGRSGGRGRDGTVDPWSHFVNAYVLDRQGKRIDRRNAQDIVVALYDHQIPPGAADVVHYRFTVPEGLKDPVTVDVALKYRKFDTTYMQHVYGKDFVNDLPVVTLAEDRLTFPVAGVPGEVRREDSEIPLWQRWNDYGIGLLLKGSKGAHKGELRQAEQAFAEVEKLGRPDGPLNRARVYIKEGRLREAVDALRAAAAHDPPAPPWSVAWFTGIVNMENGNLDDAIENLLSVAENRFEAAHRRGFDFSEDYRLQNKLGLALLRRSYVEKGATRRSQRDLFLDEARRRFEKALQHDPENVTAHHNLSLIHAKLGNPEVASRHAALHEKYKPDDNARDRLVALHRAANPAADHAAESIVIYDLQRPGAYEFPGRVDED